MHAVGKLDWLMRMARFHRDVGHLHILDTVEDKELGTRTHGTDVHGEPRERRTESAMVIQEANNPSWDFYHDPLHASLKN